MYSPHTAIDCAPGGLGDFLADIVSGIRTDPSEIEEAEAPATNDQSRPASPVKQSGQPTPLERSDPFLEPRRPVFHLQHHPSQLSIKDAALKLASDRHTRVPITKCKVPGYENTTAGMGRIVRFREPQPLLSIIDRIGLGLGNPKGFPIAIPQGKQMDEIEISSVALCAGSGGGLFAGLGKNGQEDVDLLFTGELSHHEALAAIEQGKCVITLFHSNTERGFLHSVLKPQLEKTIKEEVSLSSDDTRQCFGGTFANLDVHSGVEFAARREASLVWATTTWTLSMTTTSRSTSARWTETRTAS